MSQRFFGTDGLRGRANTYPMTVDIALRLGLAAGISFRHTFHKKGRDKSFFTIRPSCVLQN